MKSISSQALNSNNYLDFQYPETTYLLEPNYDLSLTLSDLPLLKNSVPSTGSIPIVGSPTNGKVSIDLNLILKEESLTLDGAKILFKDELNIKGARFQPACSSLKIIQALYTHSFFIKMFAHHPRNFGLTAKAINGLCISTEPQDNINAKNYRWGAKAGKRSPYQFLIETLELARYNNYNISSIHRQLPIEYTSLSYAWITEDTNAELFGTFFLVPVVYNPNHTNLECQKEKQTMPENTHHELCPDTDIYWALGQVGMTQHVEYAKWNNIDEIKELAEKVLAKNSRINSLVVGALTDPKNIQGGRIKQELRVKFAEGRIDFKNETIKPTILKNLIWEVDRENVRKHSLINYGNHINIYYHPFFWPRDFNLGKNEVGLRSHFKVYDLIPNKEKTIVTEVGLNKIYACVEIIFISNVATSISLAEEIRRKKMVIKDISQLMQANKSKNLGCMIIVEDYSRAYIAKSFETFGKYKTLFGLAESDRIRIISPEEAFSLDTSELCSY
jgi:hypothetical protein